MQNFISEGDVVSVAAPYALDSGDGCLVGTLFGVAVTAAAEAATVQIKTSGVFTMPKTSAQAWTVGAAIYWDDTNKVCTTTSTSNTLVGKAMAAASNPSSTGRVRIG